jgi:uncharacterized membrane protein
LIILGCCNIFNVRIYLANTIATSGFVWLIRLIATIVLVDMVLALNTIEYAPWPISYNNS